MNAAQHSVPGDHRDNAPDPRQPGTEPPGQAASRWAGKTKNLFKEKSRMIGEIKQDTQKTTRSKSIAIFGVGPGLGQAVARRYAQEGYTVILVARQQEPLASLAKELASAGAAAYVITADLSDTKAIPVLAKQIRSTVGNLDAFYYAPTPSGGFIPAVNLTPQHANDFMPLSLYTLIALVQEFLPHMLEQGEGAILTAQGASSVRGLPHMSGPGLAQAAQRNYLQSLHAEVAEKGVYVGMLYIGVAIEHSAFHTDMEKAKAAGEPVWEMPTIDPHHLADLLWRMHSKKGQPEATYPEVLFNH